MKRKLLATLLCLAISVSMVACGSKDSSTEQTETNTNEENTTIVQEMEVIEAETQEAQIQETEENVEETNDNRESASVPVDGRDGSQENPYRVGDTIYFPKVVMSHRYDGKEYTSLTVVVEEATSEYIKVTYKFEADSWGESWTAFDDLAYMVTVDSELMSKEGILKAQIEEKGNNEFTVVYQTAEGLGCAEDTAYLMLTFTNFCMQEDIEDISLFGAGEYPLLIEVSNQ